MRMKFATGTDEFERWFLILIFFVNCFLDLILQMNKFSMEEIKESFSRDSENLNTISIWKIYED